MCCSQSPIPHNNSCIKMFSIEIQVQVGDDASNNERIIQSTGSSPISTSIIKIPYIKKAQACEDSDFFLYTLHIST